MSPASMRRLKVAIGLLLGLAIGAGCRLLGIPSPAPSVMTGALLVVAMTSGYVLADRWLCPAGAEHEDLCGGPDGSLEGDRQGDR